MNVYLPNYDAKAIGGGWSFIRTLRAALNREVYFVDSLEKAGFMLVCGPTLVSRDEFNKAKLLGVQIILRIDNIPEDYRNRGTALSRLKEFSEGADVVVYQSEWAKEYVMGFTGVDGTVIYNAVNEKIFHDKNRSNENRVLYVRSSTNENKRWQEAKYWFRQKWLEDKNLNFTVVGNFADYIKLYGQDFIDRYRLGLFDEPYDYLGQIKTAEQMADVYRRCKVVLAPYYNDACSNTVIEALMCGSLVEQCWSGVSGGTPELLRLYTKHGRDYFTMDRLKKEYMGLFNLMLTT